MADAKRKTDWTKTGTIAGYAKYLREQSGALAVMVIRRDDAVLSADALIAPRDVEMLIADRVGALVNDLRLSREERRPAARVSLGGLHE
jgi:cysteine synthase